MSVTARLLSLQNRHHEIDDMIREEAARPLPNFDSIHRWKKQKLKIKDAIQQLGGRNVAHIT